MRVEQALLRQHAPLGGGERIGRVAPLVLEQVAQILVGRDAEQPARGGGTARGELEIGEIGAAVGAAQPVLLLGEVVVADAGAMELAQRRLGRAEVAFARRGAWRCEAAGRRSSRAPAPGGRRTGAAAQCRARPRRASARRSRANRWRARPKLHHGTSSIRRSTASTSPDGVPKRPRSTVENMSRLSTTPLVQRPSISFGKAMSVIPPPRRAPRLRRDRRRSSARGRPARGR